LDAVLLPSAPFSSPIRRKKKEKKRERGGGKIRRDFLDFLGPVEKVGEKKKKFVKEGGGKAIDGAFPMLNRKGKRRGGFQFVD